MTCSKTKKKNQEGNVENIIWGKQFKLEKTGEQNGLEGKIPISVVEHEKLDQHYKEP